MPGIGQRPPSAGRNNVAPGHRRCNKCREVKLLSEFTWGPAWGREKRCKGCKSAQSAALYQKKKESAAWIESMEK